MGAKAVMGSKGAPLSIGCRLAQHGSSVSKHNSLRVVATAVYDGGTPECRAGPDPRESLTARRSPPPRRPDTAAGTLARAVCRQADTGIAPLDEADEP